MVREHFHSCVSGPPGTPLGSDLRSLRISNRFILLADAGCRLLIKCVITEYLCCWQSSSKTYSLPREHVGRVTQQASLITPGAPGGNSPSISQKSLNQTIPASEDGTDLWGLGATARPKKSTSGCRTRTYGGKERDEVNQEVSKTLSPTRRSITKNSQVNAHTILINLIFQSPSGTVTQWLLIILISAL